MSERERERGEKVKKRGTEMKSAYTFSRASVVERMCVRESKIPRVNWTLSPSL